MLLSWIVVGAFIAVTLAAAARLLATHRQTGGLPELLIATLILGVGTLGVGGGFVIAATVPEGSLRIALGFVPIAGVSVGMAALSVFTWRVYHPESALARAFAATLVAALIAIVLYAASQGSTLVLAERPIAIGSSVLYVTTMAWSSVEALLYWRAMRRRLSLGLADALVTNRFLLWGLATGTAAQGIAIGAVARLGMGVANEAAAISLCYAVHGSITAIFFWLAFAPPPRYAGWIERRATAR